MFFAIGNVDCGYININIMTHHNYITKYLHYFRMVGIDMVSWDIEYVLWIWEVKTKDQERGNNDCSKTMQLV